MQSLAWPIPTPSGMPQMIEVAAHVEHEPPHYDSFSKLKDDFNPDPSQARNRDNKTALGEQPPKGGRTYGTYQTKE